jgi:hypothetical protein
LDKDNRESMGGILLGALDFGVQPFCPVAAIPQLRETWGVFWVGVTERVHVLMSTAGSGPPIVG